LKARKKLTIVEGKGFPDTLDPFDNNHGDGTHALSVVLKTNPMVSVFIARVIDNVGNIIEDDDYLYTAKVGFFPSKGLIVVGH
jgi:hypothetical protein